MAKKTQQERAQTYLERNPKIKELFGTSDGFNFEKIQDALSHSTTLDNKGLTVYRANGKSETLDTKEPISDQPDFLKLSVKKMGEALSEINDLEALKGYLDYEQKTEQPRSTAVKAIESRIKELTVTE